MGILLFKLCDAKSKSSDVGSQTAEGNSVERSSPVHGILASGGSIIWLEVEI